MIILINFVNRVKIERPLRPRKIAAAIDDGRYDKMRRVGDFRDSHYHASKQEVNIDEILHCFQSCDSMTKTREEISHG